MFGGVCLSLTELACLNSGESTEVSGPDEIAVVIARVMVISLLAVAFSYKSTIESGIAFISSKTSRRTSSLMVVEWEQASF